MIKDYQTIAAISTPPGEGGIGIIRISGSQALAIAFKVLQIPGLRGKTPKVRRVYHGYVVDQSKKEKVDEVIFFYFKNPNSYTGEDVAEIQTHGGIAVLRKTLELILAAGAVLAEAGEFTKRAFLNGRLDLTQAEAVMDLIQANSEEGAKQAMLQLDGALGRFVRKTLSRILNLIASIEVSLDFPEDYDPLDREALLAVLAEVEAELRELLSTFKQGNLVRQGLKTVIVGRPNVGKSTLLNSLLGEDRAIVTSTAGTTRDVLEEYYNLEGITLRLVDTAGLRQSQDEIEMMGIARTRSAIDTADLILWVVDAEEDLQDEDRELASLIKDKPYIPVINKTDLRHGQKIAADLKYLDLNREPVMIAAAPGQGLDDLRQAISQLVFAGKALAKNTPILTKTRHQQSVSQAMEQIAACQQAVAAYLPEDCYVIHLKDAYEALASLVGEGSYDEIIENIFAQFCVGK